jgi:predicted DNA binding CopG/RHH family protein
MSTDKSKEIDIQAALSILSDRTADSSSSKAEDGCGCHGTKPPENAKNMGQKIDLLPGKQEGNEEEEQKILEEKVEQERAQQERAKRHEDIRKELNNMGNPELLQALLKAQEDRVAAYREYER